MKQSGLFFETTALNVLNSVNKLGNRSKLTISGINEIYIADSSVIALSPSLAKHFPGAGSKGTESSIKIHGFYNLSTHQFARIYISDGKTSDHSEKSAHNMILKERDLIIRDLGYFEISDLKHLDKTHRHFLSRVPLSVKNFVTESGEKINIWENLPLSEFYLDQIFFLGEDKYRTRVVALKLPRKQGKIREKKMQKDRGRPLTDKEKLQANWNIYVTNVPAEIINKDQIKLLYAWRWQIELIWKALKSELKIDNVKTSTCRTIVLAYIWARLLLAIVLAHIRGIIQAQKKFEIGFILWYRRVTPQLALIRELVRVEHWDCLAELFIFIAENHCSPEKRKRKSTLEKTMISYGYKL